tara:strand:- start:32514 stop:33713 length:1200 start_codon:yes stop_codon:yes gene_type:complete
MGSELVVVSPDSTITTLGDVGNDSLFATLDYSFDYLGVVSNRNFFLYDGKTVEQVVDGDLGRVLDFIWVDGYFMLTDGEFLIVTELTDPFSINPLKYGSSEADPDPVKALLKLRNEPYALNRYTIEVFDNVGGTGFPFQRVDGAQIQRGTVGTHTCCLFMESVAFIGGGRREAISVWIAASGSSARIATREIDLVLATYSEKTLSKALIEPRVDKGHQYLYIHLPDQTLVYDANASQVVGEPVWFVLGSGLSRDSKYRAVNLVWCYDQWLIGDNVNPSIGFLDYSSSAHWGKDIGWDFNTVILYNEGRGSIFHEIELVGLSGRCELNIDDSVGTQYSLDGEYWSQIRYVKAGKIGRRNKRLVWLNQGDMRHWRMQRFSGTSKSRLSIARIEARIEPLGV